MTLTLQQGNDIVIFARSVVEGYFTKHKPKIAHSLLPIVNEKRGVFVTIHEGRGLRGCIGFPEPIKPLGQAVEQAALSAALDDPRFPAVRRTELSRLTFEVSVLSNPKLLKIPDPKAYSKHIVLGRDGLIAQRGMARGLLLPQVPVEHEWDAQEFLEHTCMKAGLMIDEYQKKNFELYTFHAQIFAEDSPQGDVYERKMMPKAPEAP